jgi:excisionase family DNA binding protein
MRYITKTNFLTVKEVSELLKLSVLTIYKYIRERRLEVVEFGGHYRIDKLSLEKFIDSHRIREDKIPYEK